MAGGGRLNCVESSGDLGSILFIFYNMKSFDGGGGGGGGGGE